MAPTITTNPLRVQACLTAMTYLIGFQPGMSQIERYALLERACCGDTHLMAATMDVLLAASSEATHAKKLNH